MPVQPVRSTVGLKGVRAPDFDSVTAPNDYATLRLIAEANAVEAVFCPWS
jgi:hypothetical protein